MRRIAALVALVALLVVGVGPVSAATGGSGLFTISVNPTGTVTTRTGLATVSGTVSCDSATPPATIFEIDLTLTQPVGRLHVVSGGASQFGLSLSCSPGTPTPWSAVAVPFNGKFGAGTAFATVGVFGCDQLVCSFDQATGTVRLAH